VVEANYEFLKSDGYVDGGSTQALQQQEYWTMLTGATGRIYGSGDFANREGRGTRLETPGVV